MFFSKLILMNNAYFANMYMYMYMSLYSYISTNITARKNNLFIQFR